MGGAGGAEAPAKTLEGFWREEEEERETEWWKQGEIE